MAAPTPRRAARPADCCPRRDPTSPSREVASSALDTNTVASRRRRASTVPPTADAARSTHPRRVGRAPSTARDIRQAAVAVLALVAFLAVMAMAVGWAITS